MFKYRTMRGQQSLFNDMFPSELQTPDKQRPRNYYLPQRNEALFHRFYFYAEIKRLRYDDCIANLEREFYITAPRIIVILQAHSDEIKKIVLKKPSTKVLKEKFRHFSW